ncbi:response regulator [bacterium]|nr:response regulator [bacterium]
MKLWSNKIKISHMVTGFAAVSLAVIFILAVSIIRQGTDNVDIMRVNYYEHVKPLGELRRMQSVLREFEFRMSGVMADIVAPIGAAEHLKLSVIELETIWQRVKDHLPVHTGDNVAKFSLGLSRFRSMAIDLQESYFNEDIDGVRVMSDRWLELKPAVFKELDYIASEMAIDLEKNFNYHQMHMEDTNIYAIAGLIVIGIIFPIAAVFMIKSIQVRMTTQTWLATGQAGLSEKMRGEQELLALTQNIISYLVTYLESQIGALYLVNDSGQLFYCCGYGYEKAEGTARVFELGEGLVGQAAQEKKILIVEDVPEHYVKVRSATGEARPAVIAVVPLIYEGKVMGIIEIASLHRMKPLHREYLERSLGSIALALHTAMARLKIDDLLERTQLQKADLNIQQEELQQINEELEQQSVALEKKKNELKEKNIALEKGNQEIEKKAAELEQSNVYKSQFLANMSHELRTPLNSMLILSRLLADNKEGRLSEKQVEYASTINGAGTDLLSLISDILDLSKVEAGKMEVQHDTVILHDFASNIERSFRHIAENKKLSMSLDIEEGLPEAIYTDRQRLDQIVRNFLSNAFKFTGEGGIEIGIGRPAPGTHMTRSGLSKSSTVAISVSDTGTGVPEDKRDLIFEAFQQADGSTGRQFGGTGLGLTISRDLASLLGGEIQLKANGEKGSRFTLYLPERHEDFDDSYLSLSGGDAGININAPETVHIEDIRDDRLAVLNTEKTVLIIEDDPKFAKILFDMTVERGFKGIIAGDGEAGLHMADYLRPDAIILDIGLPKIDGLEVMARLKKNRAIANVPIHVISAYHRSIEALKSGAIGFMQKPVSVEQLEGLFDNIGHSGPGISKRILIVEDDTALLGAMEALLANDGIETSCARTAREALSLLRAEVFDCTIIDLGLPDASGLELIQMMRRDRDIPHTPVIINTGQDISEDEEVRLREVAESVIIKGLKSVERLQDEVSLFLYGIRAEDSGVKQHRSGGPDEHEDYLSGKKVLIVDDDMRNIFALISILESVGIEPIAAKNGQEALDCLNENPSTDIVLMDLMMPVMDGYTAIREIRKQPRFKKLPVIAVTAKAMRGDRAECIEAGADDYLPKPIDVDKLLSLVRVWVCR